MARFPKITRPCPLSREEQRSIDGHCAHCNKHVHNLDALDDAGREALMASAKGEICVSYRRPLRAVATAAIALTLAAGAAGCSREPVEVMDEPVEVMDMGAAPASPEWIDDSQDQAQSSGEGESEPASAPASEAR